MGAGRKYDEEFKIQALKLANEVRPKQTATELGMPESTLSGWIYKIDQNEANEVRMIFDMYIQGETKTAICERLIKQTRI